MELFLSNFDASLKIGNVQSMGVMNLQNNDEFVGNTFFYGNIYK